MQLVAAKNIEIKSLNNAAAEAEMAPRGLLFLPLRPTTTSHPPTLYAPFLLWLFLLIFYCIEL